MNCYGNITKTYSSAQVYHLEDENLEKNSFDIILLNSSPDNH